ncbi:MAG TPA: tRNA lysidine(34) synthetase TilS [Niabella sp.]|nr:tRNA lysidine(34) synthetase TilS [Niabella sp.]HQW14925.1 tRNA lysidine(34) synthetase TilS [Niabella sp.]HQX20183.1 tRNA lysidine(34) synthetase TilS [Niabella sp.]HQX42687.1 tRNA lysidine(34) synthetase TilS [Niabella sp.]HRB06788.1 tRNA lysidine(34) synthetase TilS [Niabella sp.]
MKIKNLTQAFVTFIQQKNLFTQKDKLLLTVSGGVDSVVLCALCRQAGYDFGIAHCNFQLRGKDSEADEKFVESLAAQMLVPFHVVRFETKTFAQENKIATQEAARVLRYKWFEEIRSTYQYQFILTAHHADDNIETLLMNFFRGTGIKGITGIREKNGWLRRPLLFARRMELESFLKEQALGFVQDQSNFSNDYTRNYFRNTVLPLIAKTYPEVTENLIQNIERFKEVEQIYKQRISQLRKKILTLQGDDIYIPVLLLKQTPAMQTVLLELLSPYGFKAVQLPELMHLLESETGRYLVSATHRILKNRKHLIVSPLKHPTENIVVIDALGKYSFEAGDITLNLLNEPEISNDPNIACIDANKLQYPLLLRRWKMGDYFYPLGMDKKKKLSKFFIDNKLSLLQKENIWVLEMNKKIVWIVGQRIDNRFRVLNTTQSVLKIFVTRM